MAPSSRLFQMYSPRLLERFHEPKWAGDVARPSVTVLEGNAPCGDVVQISLKVAEGTIAEARFRTLGCAVAIAASETVCDLAIGQTLLGAEVIDLDEVSESLGGIPEGRDACASAPVAALRSALRAIRERFD